MSGSSNPSSVAADLRGFERAVAERKEAEQRLEEALALVRRSDRLKTVFLDNISHELRTPLNVIVGYTAIVGEHLASIDDSSQDRHLEAIRRAGKRLVDTMERILDYSKLVAGTLEQHRVRLLLGEVVDREVAEHRAIASEKRISLEWISGEPEVAVYFDRHSLSRTVMNLLDNALKFTSEGGVTVCTRRDAGGSLLLEIRDTGVGIDRDFVGSLAEPFLQEDTGHRRKFEGQGLGLAVTKRYLTMNDAELVVESEKGRGSTMTVRFFRASPPPRTPCPVRGAVPRVVVVGAREEVDALVGSKSPKSSERPKQPKRRKRPKWETLFAGTAEEGVRVLEEAPGVDAAVILFTPAEIDDRLTFLRSIRRHPSLWDLPVVGLDRDLLPVDRVKVAGAGCTVRIGDVWTPAAVDAAIRSLFA